MPTERWDSRQIADAKSAAATPLTTAIGRGLMCRCPNCGRGPIFRGFLKVAASCPNCAAPLGLARADDAPPYFTILLVGHILVPVIYVVDRYATPSLWIMMAIFLPLTLLLSIGLLRPIKGGTVGAMLALNMLKPDETGAH